MALTPGLLLSDRYRLTHRIAIGGMGEVWAADATRLARGVAVKILKSELTSDPEFVDRFRSEARITASLNHSGIAAVYDYGEVASTTGGPLDTAFLVMELVVGEPLSTVLARTPRLSIPRTLDVLEQSGRGGLGDGHPPVPLAGAGCRSGVTSAVRRVRPRGGGLRVSGRRPAVQRRER